MFKYALEAQTVAKKKKKCGTEMSKREFLHPFELVEIFKWVLYCTGMKRGSSKVLNAIHIRIVTMVAP